jgi:hypothetical protein
MRRRSRTLLALGGWWWIAGVHAQAPERDEWLASEEWQKDAPKDGDERRPEKQKDEDDESE